MTLTCLVLPPMLRVKVAVGMSAQVHMYGPVAMARAPSSRASSSKLCTEASSSLTIENGTARFTPSFDSGGMALPSLKTTVPSP